MRVRLLLWPQTLLARADEARLHDIDGEQ